ncbi:MAG: hypothetical protein OEM49_14290 [Myxococcales bacterium]|nr:hypothetical protein [Myxococcales bacterium]MDH5305576.1 hypothetical protein [Myxococcales bacterium]MDH5567652.1 hypothetical protein [Myxococcales bacterium]
MRRALTLGLSGLFVTEEAFRRALGETLPKDWIDFMVEQSRRTRAEVVDRLGAEVGRALQNTDLAAVLAQLLEGRSIEINAEIRLHPRGEGCAEDAPQGKRAREKRET